MEAPIFPALSPVLPAGVIISAAAVVIGLTFWSYYGSRRWVFGLLLGLAGATLAAQAWLLADRELWSGGGQIGAAAAAVLPALAAAAILAALAFWKRSIGVKTPRPTQLIALLALRLAALAVACTTLAQPYWVVDQADPRPSTIVILVDQSLSMRVTDEERRGRSSAVEPGGDERLASRFEVARQELADAQAVIQRLKEDLGVTVEVHGFDAGLTDLDLDHPPRGEQTGVLRAIDQAYERYRPFDREKSPRLLGLIVLSDFRDNMDMSRGGLDTAARTAQQRLQSKLALTPVHTILLGAPGGSQLQPDLIAEAVKAPSLARVKDRIVVSGTVRTQRFLNEEFVVYLKIDGKIAKRADRPGEDVYRVLRVRKAEDVFENIDFPPAILPDAPGDYKVSLWCEPKEGELTRTNNEVSTYVTVHKDGLSVLYFDTVRSVEPRELARALKTDPRITLYTDFVAGEPGPSAADWRIRLRKLLETTDFDVFIFGDRSAKWFEGSDGQWMLNHIRMKVETEGKGLLMIGGQRSFAAGGWNQTVLAGLLPVDRNSGREHHEADASTKAPRLLSFVPTEEGLTGQHKFILNIEYDADPDKLRELNQKLYARLPKLDGGNKLRRSGPDAVVLASIDGKEDSDVLLAVRKAGKGRAAALAVDTTFNWIQPKADDDPTPGELSFSSQAHQRFWRQLILWLAQQDKVNSSLRLEIEPRHFRTGLPVTIAARALKISPAGGKDSEVPLPGIDLKIVVKKPDGSTQTFDASSSESEEAKAVRQFTDTRQPGEYEVSVSSPKNPDLGSAFAHFSTYLDDAETQNRSTNPKLAEELARATGGKCRYHGGLVEALEALKPDKSLTIGKTTRFPSWDEPNPSLHGTLLLAFVLLISGEWLLRRLWGLV